MGIPIIYEVHVLAACAVRGVLCISIIGTRVVSRTDIHDGPCLFRYSTGPIEKTASSAFFSKTSSCAKYEGLRR